MRLKNLYLLTVEARADGGYDSYDAKVVRAADAPEARREANRQTGDEGAIWEDPRYVKIEKIGATTSGTRQRTAVVLDRLTARAEGVIDGAWASHEAEVAADLAARPSLQQIERVTQALSDGREAERRQIVTWLRTEAVRSRTASGLGRTGRSGKGADNGGALDALADRIEVGEHV